MKEKEEEGEGIYLFISFLIHYILHPSFITSPLPFSLYSLSHFIFSSNSPILPPSLPFTLPFALPPPYPFPSYPSYLPLPSSLLPFLLPFCPPSYPSSLPFIPLPFLPHFYPPSYPLTNTPTHIDKRIQFVSPDGHTPSTQVTIFS